MENRTKLYVHIMNSMMMFEEQHPGKVDEKTIMRITKFLVDVLMKPRSELCARA